MSSIKIHPSWQTILAEQFNQPYFQTLKQFIKSEYQTKTIYPHPKNIFQAYNLCPFDQTKVIILGQDPYHGPNQAHGLSFSVPPELRPPPSLQNIWKELKSDLNLDIPKLTNLEHWAKQGILLLNATLTVEANKPGSHQNQGWEQFTDATIQQLSTHRKQLVFILWGKFAQAKSKLINNKQHLILTSAHPSPLSAHNGFFGSKPFSKTNTYLLQTNQTPITWQP